MSKFEPAPPSPITVGNFNLFADDQKKADEAQKRKAEQEYRDRTTIHNWAPPVTSADIVKSVLNNRGGWTDAALIPARQAEARRKEKREAERLIAAPEPEFEKEEF